MHSSDQAHDSLNANDLRHSAAKKDESPEEYETRMIGEKNLALQPERERRREQEMNQGLLSRLGNQRPDPQRDRPQGSGRSSARRRSPGRTVVKQE